MKLLMLFVALSSALMLSGQAMFLPMNGYYKDHFQRYSGAQVIESFYPATDGQLHLADSMADTVKLYFDFHQWLFKKHCVELHHADYRLYLDPVLDISVGRGFSSLDSSMLYRNTRGFRLEAEILKNFGFQLVFAENQARFLSFEQAYFNDRGEIYTYDSSFHKANAVVPGGMRTKPFKVNGVDYAYSFGSFHWQVKPWLAIEGGNNQQFIGDGYRSLLLSDNAVAAPNLRFKFRFSSKWSYQFLIRKQQNLFRKPATKAIEAAYENKFFAAAYLSYRPSSHVEISLFTAGNQLLGDSVKKHPAGWNLWIPLPMMQTDLIGKRSITNGIAGLNLIFAASHMRFYAQLAADRVNQAWLLAAQAGVFIPKLFGLQQGNLRLEFNHVPQHFYADPYTKLAYSHYNLPSAHPKGNHFTEIMLASNWEFHRFYAQVRTSVYFTRGRNLADQLATNSIFSMDTLNAPATITALGMLEGGYRINRKYNPNLFLQLRVRQSSPGLDETGYLMILAGFRVSLFNQYLDF